LLVLQISAGSWMISTTTQASVSKYQGVTCLHLLSPGRGGSDRWWWWRQVLDSGGGWRHGAPPTSPFRLRARRGNAVFQTGLQAPEVHQPPISDFSDHRQLLLILISTPPPPPSPLPNVSLRRPCGACLRRPRAGRVCGPANPCSSVAPPARAPAPRSFYPTGSQGPIRRFFSFFITGRYLGVFLVFFGAQ
jgi:hypothetical protein